MVVLIAPKLSLNIPAKIKIVTNPGTAHGNTNTVRMIFLNRKSFWLTKTAINIPNATCNVEATIVHTIVQPKTSIKVERQISTVKMFLNVSNPTHWTKFAGGELYKL